jgi:hypothetical protein
VHLAIDANTGQICGALMTHQDIGDAEVLPDLLDEATSSIPPRDGAAPWPQRTPGAAWRNDAIDALARSGRGDWKRASCYHRRSLAETLMYRLKVLPGRSLAPRTTFHAILPNAQPRTFNTVSDSQIENRLLLIDYSKYKFDLTHYSAP